MRSFLDMPDGLNLPIHRKEIGVFGTCIRTLTDYFSESSATVISGNDLREGAVGYDVKDGKIVLRYANNSGGEDGKNKVKYGRDICYLDDRESIIITEYKRFIDDIKYGRRKNIDSFKKMQNCFDSYYVDETYGYHLKMLGNRNFISISEFRLYVRDLLLACLEATLADIRGNQITEDFLSSFHMRVLEWGLSKKIISMDSISMKYAYKKLEDRHKNENVYGELEDDLFNFLRKGTIRAV